MKKTFLLVNLFVVGGVANGAITAKEIDLSLYEKRLISQNGEDGVLQKIFKEIGTTNKYYVEFGAGDGHFCSNTKYFKEKYGWTGLLMDGACSNNMADDIRINLHKEFITADNICDLFRKYNVPKEIDLISIDIDRNDFYVWMALCGEYRPRVVVIEFNSCFNLDEDLVIAYDGSSMWNGTQHTGASMLALRNLGKKLGYSLVYQESAGVNLFFIRNDVLEKSGVTFKYVNDVRKLYTANPQSLYPYKEIFISSEDAYSKNI